MLYEATVPKAQPERWTTGVRIGAFRMTFLDHLLLVVVLRPPCRQWSRIRILAISLIHRASGE
jgi:hypothetical protein